MSNAEPATSLEELAGELHALTGGIARLRTTTDVEAIAASAAQLALVAARADLDTVLPGLPPPEPPAIGNRQVLAARLYDLGGALAAWSQSAHGDEALATAQAALHVDEAARRLTAPR